MPDLAQSGPRVASIIERTSIFT